MDSNRKLVPMRSLAFWSRSKGTNLNGQAVFAESSTDSLFNGTERTCLRSMKSRY